MTAPTQKPATAGGEQDSDLITVEGLIKHFPIRAGILRRQVAAVQAVVPVTGAGVVLVALLALVCGLPRLALVAAVPGAVAVVLAVASLGLVGAALSLERACRVPDQPDRKDEGDSGRATGRG